MLTSRALRLVFALCISLSIFGAGRADAYVLSLEPTTPTVGDVGDIVSFDVFLDTTNPYDNGSSRIVLLSVGMTFDPSVAMYRPDLSAVDDYYPLYHPGIGKSYPATWLEPLSNPPALYGSPPPGMEQVNIDFIEVNLLGALGASTRLYLATLSFELVGEGVSSGTWGFGGGADIPFSDVPQKNVFAVDAPTGGNPWPPENGFFHDDSENVGLLGSPAMTVIPEPSVGLLVGAGLLALGLARRTGAR